MDAILLEIIELFKKFAPHWIESEVKHTITSHPDEFKKLDAEKIKSFKEEVNTLIKNIPEIVNKEMSNIVDFPHNKLIDTKNFLPDFYFDKKDKDYFDSKFKSIVSELGAILNKYEMIVYSSKYINNWERTGQGKFKYSYGISLDDSINSIIRKYYSEEEILFKLEKSNREIAKNIKELEAIELWNNA